MNRRIVLVVLSAVLFSLIGIPASAQAQLPAVHAVLFYSPTCQHCHKVMSEDLPPLLEIYGDQLVILEVNITRPDGEKLYQAAIETFNIPQDRLGVPALIVGNVLLVGSLEIPAWFPGIIENGLQQGGIPWPSLPGLTSFVEAIGTRSTSTEITMADRFALDPLGNSLAVIVLGGMLIVLFLAGYALNNKVRLTLWPDWVIPVLVVLGLVIAGYLTFVETTNSEAICGPVGDCNTVQQSEYARIFGFLPIGVLGLIGYTIIGILWALRTFSLRLPAKTSAQTLWWMTFIGTVFSIYLTFLEPFVIGATCAWCLSSAVIMTLLLWASTLILKQEMKTSRRFR